jgi:hypothetical protein
MREGTANPDAAGADDADADPSWHASGGDRGGRRTRNGQAVGAELGTAGLVT